MTARWLLLAHQLPTRLSNARVKTWRRLQQIGAVASRNSVYVLPNTDQCREDFEWLRSEIVALGGDATVFSADAVSPGGGEEIVATFRRMRDADYRDLKREADKMMASVRGKPASGKPAGPAWDRNVRALRERFTAIQRIDFFNAAVREAAAASLAALEQRSSGRKRAALPVTALLPVADFRNRRWVTRPRPGVDRMASAWLIRRFIDPSAAFAFVDPAFARPADEPLRGQPAEDVPFDMFIGEFSHQGPLCTFEVLAQRFGLADPVVEHIGQIVHDLDMRDTKYGSPDAPAIGRVVEGLRQIHADDQILLEHGIEMFEALARAFSSPDTR
jgi:hypothetical protein